MLPVAFLQPTARSRNHCSTSSLGFSRLMPLFPVQKAKIQVVLHPAALIGLSPQKAAALQLSCGTRTGTARGEGWADGAEALAVLIRGELNTAGRVGGYD